MRYIHEIISDVVDSLRLTGVTTNITNVSGNTYEFSTDASELEVGEYIEIIGAATFEEEGYKITDKNDTYFRIETTESITISSYGSWKQKKWHFEFGRFKEVSEIITLFSGKSKNFDPFPMVWMVSTFTQSYEELRFQETISNLRIIFINRTQYRSTIEKYDNNIQTVIDPYFELFKRAINDRVELWRPYDNLKFDFENMPPYSENNNNKFTTKTDAKVVDYKTISIMKENDC